MIASSARVAVGAALWLGAIAVAVVLACAAASLVPSSTNQATLVLSMAWAVYGPQMVVASAAALVVAGARALARGWRRRLVALTAGAGAALAASSAATAMIAAAAGTAAVVPAALAFAGPARGADQVEVYAVVEGQPLHALVYRPARAAAAAPVLLYLHGGGWISGAPDLFPDGGWYADRGWLVVSVEYRLATTERPGWDLAPADAGCALAWTVAAAPRLGGDPHRVAVLGDSAGGNLAVNLGWGAAAGRARSSCPERGAVPVPAAVVAGYPVLDPAGDYAHGQPGLFGQRPQDFVAEYLGGPPAAHPDRVAAISPLTHASPAAPPTLVVEPERDQFVPADGVYAAVEQARGAGVRVTLVRVPLAVHAFDGLAGSLGDQVKRVLVVRYLASVGLAPAACQSMCSA